MCALFQPLGALDVRIAWANEMPGTLPDSFTKILASRSRTKICGNSSGTGGHHGESSEFARPNLLEILMKILAIAKVQISASGSAIVATSQNGALLK
jgi:hypothetical protein